MRRTTLYAPLLYHTRVVFSRPPIAQPTPEAYNIWLDYDTSMPRNR